MAMPADVRDANETVFVGNLDPLVKEEILYELFLQAGPVRKVTIARDREGRQRTFGFVLYKHAEAVPYAIALLNGICLYGRPLKLDFSTGSSQDTGSFGSPGTEDRGPNADRRGVCPQNSVCTFSCFIPHGDCRSQDQITGRNMVYNWRPCPLPPLTHQVPPLPFTAPFTSTPLQPWPVGFWTPPLTPLLPIAPPPQEQDREEPLPTPTEREKEREREMERERSVVPGKGRVRDGEKPQVLTKQRERERQKPPVRGRERDGEKPLVLTKEKSKERVNLPLHPKKQVKEKELEVQWHRRKRRRGRKHQHQNRQKT